MRDLSIENNLNTRSSNAAKTLADSQHLPQLENEISIKNMDSPWTHSCPPTVRLT